MVETKGLDSVVADKIGTFVALAGKPLELLPVLESNAELMSNNIAKEGVASLKLLFEYLGYFDCLDKVNDYDFEFWR